jgi:hypothetical protein
MKATKSKTSPKGGKRGCLCKDGKYNKECCNGDLQAQGIGSTTNQNTEPIITVIDGTRTIVRTSN